MRRRSHRGITPVMSALGLVALIALGSYSAYYAFETRTNGGASYSGFTVTLTTSNTNLKLPKGEVLVVIPQGINNNTQLTFQPANLFLVLGVNSTVFFYNQDSTEHVIQSVQWPLQGQPFDLWLPQGQNGTVHLYAAGTYVYNFEQNPVGENGTITVL
jgi:hypothetical protein